MRKLLTFFAVLLLTVAAWAQNPKLSYQAVVRDNSNKLVTNSNIDVTISVLRMDNSLQYTQSFAAVPTNRNGLISLLIGGEADWDDIDWLHSKIAVSITLPNHSVVEDTTEVNAVPLAINTMHSETVDPSALVQSNWTQVDTEDPSFIQNKPSISDTVNTILTTEGYVTATTLDGRHYLTSDSAVITTMQHDIANLTLHTTQHAIRDSVAGQIHDSISNMSAASHTHNNKALLDTYTQTEADLADAVDKKHTHENQDVLDRIDRAYSETDSAKLAGIAEGAEVNVQADWNQNTITADDYIKNKPELFSGDYNDLTNKPSISDTVNGLLDTKGYLTSTSDVITTLQNDLSAAIGKEKTDSITLATRIDELENAQMDCNKVKDCIKDTLSQYVTADLLCNAVKDCDFSNNTSIATLLQGLSSQISSLQNQVDAQNRKIDSLSRLPHGGDTPTDTFKCGTDKVKDVDSNTYNTVKIGNQCWTKENLRTTTKRNNVGNIYNPQDTMPEYDVTTYGLLYDWEAVMQGESGNKVRGICPEGWHVPSNAEWDILTTYVNSVAEYRCGGADDAIAKALSSTSDWTESSNDCDVGNFPTNNNATGFAAVPAGGYYGTLGISNFGKGAYMWSSTQKNNDHAWYRLLGYGKADVIRSYGYKNTCYSVRCLRNVGTGGDTTSTPAEVSCEQVMNCLGDTLGKLNARITSQGAEIEELNATVTAQGQTITAQGNTIDSLSHIVDSLSNLPHGGRGAFTCGSTVTDHQGNVYNTLQIGNQCWTKENMRCTTSPITGASILVNPADATSSGKKAFYYDNVPANADNGYGLLYNWYATVDTFYTGEISEIELSGHHRGICPKGWHVPSVGEWTDLTSFVKSQPDYRCGENEWDIAKALASKTGWTQDVVLINSCSVGGYSESNNATGFSALPAGYYHQSNGFVGRGDSALFWSSTSYNSCFTRDLQLSYVDGGVMENQYSSVNHGLSVRCVWNGDAGGGDTPDTPGGGEMPGSDEPDEPTTFTCGTDKVKDVQDNEYSTVQIGSQCWMAQNLRTKVEGSEYPKNGDNHVTGEDTVIYGRLYTWTAVTKGASTTYPQNGTDTLVHGICPAGWHVPSDAEWDTLTYYVYNSTNPDYKCSGCTTTVWSQSTECIAKALSTTTGWSSSSDSGCNAGNSGEKSNATGFSAVPAGYCFLGGFDGFGRIAYFWSATEYEDDSDGAWYRYLSSSVSNVDRGHFNKSHGISVRCLRDN